MVTSQEDHEQWLLDIWNSRIANEDLVYILGDISFGKYDQTKWLLARLKGQKIVIKGNHDNEQHLNRLKQEGIILSWKLYDEVDIQGTKTCLMHYPIASWNRQHYGSYMLHGHCVDLQTELLTLEGWKSFGSFTKGDEVWSYNPETSLLERDYIDQIYSPLYTGKMFTLSGKSVSARMTSDHRMVGVSLHSNKFIDFTPSTCQKSHVKLIHSGFNHGEGLPLSDDLIRLYVYCAADGSLKEKTGLWRIRVKKEHKVKELHRCLMAVGIQYKTYLSNGYVSFNFYCPNFSGMVVKGLDRRLTKMSSDQFKVFLDAYSLSDGNKNGNGVIVYTSKSSEKDIIQEIAVINGFSCTLNTRVNHGFSSSASYQLSIYPRQTVIANGIHEMQVEDVVDEQVWCIKNRNANFFVRRNGKVHLTGNCHGMYQGHGKILDVGIDSAYNALGEHTLFSDEEIVAYMQQQEIYIADSHRKEIQ